MVDDTIREADAADAPAIARLIRQSKAEAMPWLAVLHSLEEDEEWVAGMLLPDHDVRVAVDVADHGAVVGVIATSPGWINQIYVATSAQGRGVGSRLMRLAQATTTAALQVWTFQRNTRARGFYERRGFVEQRRTDGDNEEREPDVLYRWELP
jgi:GNAT superfamily N-acetyltransferase